jgi:hypothetical protein
MWGGETYPLEVSTSVDTILEDSFPASDPPSWTLGVEPPRPVPQTCARCGRPLDAGGSGMMVKRAGASFCSAACATAVVAPDAASLR